jgi:hypothetical protein
MISSLYGDAVSGEELICQRTDRSKAPIQRVGFTAGIPQDLLATERGEK